MFFINHLDNGIPKTINNFDSILIFLGSICHESFEVWFKIPVLEHCVVHDLLCFSVFRLHVVNYNGHSL
jgi:hypothetical protein